MNKNCYESSKYTFAEAQMCETFHYDNDYKLNSIKTFWKDHVSKHVKSYQECNKASASLATIADKDKAFADCHKDWIREFKTNQSQLLEVRAREFLGKNLD